MKKKLFLAALALTALVSCTSDEFVGDLSQQNSSGTSGTINFNPSSKALTRATSNTGPVAPMLDGQRKIFGVKKTNASGSNPVAYATVFDNYVLWSNTTNVTTSNPDATTPTDAVNGWEYVGTSTQTYGASATTLGQDQYIKYWDWSTDEYHFVAGSPVANFTYNITSGDIASATVTGIAGHINPNSGTALTTNPVYIAAPVKKPSAQYNTDVVFSFTRQQAFVRVGVFETIPGYKITEIKFYPYDEESDAWGTTPGDNIVLASTATSPAKYFQGATSGTATITYDWTTPSSTFDYTASTLTIQKNWYGGKYNYPAVTGSTAAAAWEMATSSAVTDYDKLYGKDADRGDKGYFTVIPMKSGGTAQPILVKCDYVLKALDTNETIKVSGATAAIPAAFTYWNPNTSYTYLFKISDNTNGKTGSSQPNEGLYPITFDAVVVAETDGTEQGTITTVSTPSITTYQAGSVTESGIEYKTGTSIYLTVQDNTSGALKTLTDGGAAVGAVQVYKLSAAINADPAPTEADLQITAPTGTDLFTLGSAAATVDNVTLPASQHGSFTPSEAGYYAIQYLNTAAVTDPVKPAAYTYKIVKVVGS